MGKTLAEALCGLCSNGEGFDDAIRMLEDHPKLARAGLLRLLDHPDPAWRRGAATAMARLKSSPASSMPALLRMLRSPDASDKIAALAAMDYLPAAMRARVVPQVIAVLKSRPVGLPIYTRVRAHLPRSVAAHFLATHAGAAGIKVLTSLARNPRDPIAHQIKAALDRATSPDASRV